MTINLIKQIQTQCDNIKSFNSQTEPLFDILIAKYKEEYKKLGDYVSREVLFRQINSEKIVEHVDRLNQLNKEGWNIYLRLSNFYQNNFFLIDDVSKTHLYQINASINTYWSIEKYNTKFKLVDIIQTSTNNYQVLLYNENPLKFIDKNKISNGLADLFNADKACTDIGKFFRLVGFQNMKPTHVKNGQTIMIEQALHFYNLFKQQEQENMNLNTKDQFNQSLNTNHFDDLENLLNDSESLDKKTL